MEFSNSIRLGPWQWLGVALFACLLVVFVPTIWKQLEEFSLEPDYRMPYELSNDYWLYRRFADAASTRYDVFLIGDSVIWGEYVPREQTLSHHLNALGGRERCANLGLDGAHPLALSGLVEHYASSVSGKDVLLECNPLWLSSLQSDLQGAEKPNDFSHARLVPQFVPEIPRFKQEVSYRLGVLVEQRVSFNQWTNHLQQAYYKQTDIPSWTMEHPYDNPFKPLTTGIPPSDNALRHLPQPWYANDKSKRDFAWIDLESSLQWHAFQRTVETLQRRGNRVFVLVGPFNEHILTTASLARYEKVRATIGAWLKDKQVAHAIPAALPSELYGDASHPLAEGYLVLARKLQEEPFFRK